MAPRPLLISVALLGVALDASAASHFWLSETSAGSSGPEAPSIGITTGDTKTLYLWGRPDSGRQFEAISIDVISSVSGLDFVDGTFTFYNEIDDSTDRFEFTRDSSTTPRVDSTVPPEDVLDFGDIDDLIGLRGFTLTGSSSLRGPGPHCAAGETGCEVAGDGEPAWLVASFDVTGVTAGSIDLYLQIGDRGVVERELAAGDYDLDGEVAVADLAVWVGAFGDTTGPADGNGDGVVDAADYTIWRDHLGDTATSLTASDTEVRFGVDGMGGDEPLYNASTDKETTLGGDDPDVSFTISVPATSVPEPGSVALAVLGLLISSQPRRPTPV